MTPLRKASIALAAVIALTLTTGCEGLTGPVPDVGNPGNNNPVDPGNPDRSRPVDPGTPDPGTPNPGDDKTGGTGVNMPGVIDQINKHRRAAGAKAMVRDTNLEVTAKKCAISNRNASPPGGLNLSHSLPGCGYENLYASSYTKVSANEVVTTWMNSPGHRRAMLDPSMGKIAIGYASAPGKGIFVAAAFKR